MQGAPISKIRVFFLFFFFSFSFFYFYFILFFFCVCVCVCENRFFGTSVYAIQTFSFRKINSYAKMISRAEHSSLVYHLMQILSIFLINGYHVWQSIHGAFFRIAPSCFVATLTDMLVYSMKQKRLI